MVLRSLALITLCTGACLAQAQSATERQRTATGDFQAFLGTWELDAVRTKLGSSTFSYEQAGDSIRATNPSGSYTFKIDGNEYKTASPTDVISWKQVDENTLETTVKRNGKLQSTSTRVFSPDKKTITITTKVMGENPATLTSKMERQTPPTSGHPLIGTWKQQPALQPGQTARMTYTAAPGGLHVKYEAPIQQEYTLTFDGQAHAIDSGSGPSADLIARKINERTIEENWTAQGKAFTTSTITVSADGQELTERNQPAEGRGEPSTYVYRRAK